VRIQVTYRWDGLTKDGKRAVDHYVTLCYANKDAAREGIAQEAGRKLIPIASTAIDGLGYPIFQPVNLTQGNPKMISFFR
jgi:hypothetical protein